MRMIDADELKKTIINICGNCSNIIREYKEGIPDGNCAIQHIMNMIDNAPTVYKPSDNDITDFYPKIMVEVTEHHTFAKPDDVEDLDFPGVSSEDK